MASNMTAPAPATGAMPDIPDFLRRDQPSWRNTLKIHPACELIPPVSDADLDALGDDILANGLTAPIALTPDGLLLDGRSRLDALERKGVKVSIYTDEWSLALEGRADKQAFERVHRTISIMIIKTDPVAYVISTNLHRRHLTAEQKRDLIAKLLKAKPDLSDRAIGKMTKADGKTVAKARANAEFPHNDRTEATGRKARGRKPQPAAKVSGNNFEDDTFEPDETVEDSRTVLINVLNSIKQSKAVAEAYRKILKASPFDRGAKKEISDAIELLIRKWRSVQSTLATGVEQQTVEGDAS